MVQEQSNNKMNCKVKIINKSNNPLPKYETDGSAGMDIRANEAVELLCHEIKVVKTGLYLEIPKGWQAEVRSRSGLAAKHGIIVLNSPGTIDSDYRGEIKVILYTTRIPYTIQKGDRIAQIVFTRAEQAELITVNELSETDRGQGGFGSTGNH